MKSEYFETMRKLKKQLIPEFSNILHKLRPQYSLLLDNEEFMVFYNKRIFSNAVLLRPYITKVFLSLDGSDEWIKHKLILALVEIVNISTYQSNIVMDSKDDRISENSNNHIISSIFSKLLVGEVVNESHYSDADKLFIFRTITKCLQDLYYGQYIDTNVLRFSNTSLSSSEVEDLYLKRCELLGGSLIQMCANFAINFNPNLKPISEELNKIAKCFGIAGQILNDIGDITSESRIYSTQKFSDIKNERLTIPIYYVNNYISGDYNKSNIIEALNKVTNVENLRRDIRRFIEPYIALIYSQLDIIRLNGYNTNELEQIIALLEKSRYIS